MDHTTLEKYAATFEASQFGGYRAKVVNPQGAVTYLSQQSWPTANEATKAAEQYKNTQMASGRYDSASKLDAIADAVNCMVQDAKRLRERADAALGGGADAEEKDYHFTVYERSSGLVKGGRVGEGKKTTIVVRAASEQEAQKNANAQAKRGGYDYAELTKGK